MAISANQVTMLRILLLPVPVYLLIYGGPVQWWVSFGLFVVLGMTDFIDGVMARREGGTKLGALIDPVADKIFLSALLLSMVTIGMLPSWLISALLVRELLITALRSSVAHRQAAIKTSTLGKLKTIIQMGGLGTIFLTIVTGPYFPNLCILLSIPFLLAALPYLFMKKRPKFWMLPVFLAMCGTGILGHFIDTQSVVLIQVVIIVAITWASAIDYLSGCYRLFRQSGITNGEFIRIAWSLVFGLLVAPLVAHFPIMVLPILVSISLEFGLGGIDNIVVAEKKIFSPWPFLFSSIAGLLFAICVNGIIYFALPINPFYLALALALVSAITCGATFGRHVDIFRRQRA